MCSQKFYEDLLIDIETFFHLIIDHNYIKNYPRELFKPSLEKEIVEYFQTIIVLQHLKGH